MGAKSVVRGPMSPELMELLEAHSGWVDNPRAVKPTVISSVPITRPSTPALSFNKVTATGLHVKYATFRGWDFSEANLDRGVFHECVFIECNFEKTLFQSANFQKCTFGSCDFTKTDFTGAFLGASFRVCDFDKVNLTKAVTAQADFGWAAKPVFVDVERSYVMYVFRNAKGGPRILCGCRNFTIQEAYSHWLQYKIKDRPGYLKAVKALAEKCGVTLK